MRKIIEWLMPSKKAARLKREADYQAAAERLRERAAAKVVPLTARAAVERERRLVYVPQVTARDLAPTQPYQPVPPGHDPLLWLCPNLYAQSASPAPSQAPVHRDVIGGGGSFDGAGASADWSSCSSAASSSDSSSSYSSDSSSSSSSDSSSSCSSSD